MTEQQGPGSEDQGERQVVIVGPDGQPLGAVPASALVAREAGDDDGDGSERSIAEQVEQPAKVMRIGSMIRQLLEEVKAAPLDEASRARLREIHRSSIKELEDGLAPELIGELERLSLPFTEDAVPSESELRIAQAHRGRSYLYELTVPAPARGGLLGACHALDVPLVFGTTRGALTEMLLGPEPPAGIVGTSRAMRAAWTAFARGEGPGWGPYDDESRETWVIGEPPVAGRYPEETSAALWAAHEFAPLPLTGAPASA